MSVMKIMTTVIALIKSPVSLQTAPLESNLQRKFHTALILILCANVYFFF